MDVSLCQAGLCRSVFMFFCFCFLVWSVTLLLSEIKRNENSRSQTHKVIVKAFQNQTNGTITAKVAEMSPKSFPRRRLEQCLQQLQVAKVQNDAQPRSLFLISLSFYIYFIFFSVILESPSCASARITLTLYRGLLCILPIKSLHLKQ